jgi:uncharacterized integral membrane protein
MRTKRERTRLIVAFVLGALAVLFGVLNLDEVEVNWIVATWQTPLIVVILVNVILGIVIGYALAKRRGR